MHADSDSICVCADGKPRTKGTVVAHLDPRLPFVPSFLVNFMLKVASPFAFKMMKKVPAHPN